MTFLLDSKRGALSNLSERLESHKWKVSHAPEPRDIIWDNLTKTRFSKLSRRIILNLLLMLFLTLLTTPAAIFSTFQSLIRFHSVTNFFGPLMSGEGLFRKFLSGIVFSYLPALVLALLSVGMPYVFAVSTYFEGYRLKSSRERSIMRKTFVSDYRDIITLGVSLIVRVDSPNCSFDLRGGSPCAKALG